MTQPNTWDLGGDGGNSFPFDRIGDSVTGTIDSLQQVQQTDLQTGEPKTFANGEPMMMFKVGLAHSNAPRDPNNPADDGSRSIYLKGSRKAGCGSSLAAVLDAVKAATGGSQLEPNATLTLTYVGDGQATQRGFTAPKLYQATYVRPAMNLGAPVAPVAAPVQQYQAPAPLQQYAPVAQAPAQPPAQHYVAPPAPQYQASAPVAPQPTPEQIAALQAAGIDPRTYFPHWQQ